MERNPQQLKRSRAERVTTRSTPRRAARVTVGHRSGRRQGTAYVRIDAGVRKGALGRHSAGRTGPKRSGVRREFIQRSSFRMRRTSGRHQRKTRDQEQERFHKQRSELLLTAAMEGNPNAKALDQWLTRIEAAAVSAFNDSACRRVPPRRAWARRNAAPRASN